MNKNILYAAAIFAALNFSSCRKDKIKERRIEGDWKIEEYIIDGAGDLSDTDRYTQIRFEFDDDGDINQEWEVDYDGYSYTYNFSGEWEINDCELDLQFGANSATNYFCGNYGGTREVYDIIEMTKDRFELENKGDLCDGKTVTIIGTKLDD